MPDNTVHDIDVNDFIENESESQINGHQGFEPYKAYPTSFFQNKQLSCQAIAIGGYLHSMPPNWIPRPYQIRKHFNLGVWTWEKVSKELREAGYLKLITGGADKGSKLLFSIHKKFPGDDSEEEKRTPEKPRPGKTDSLETMDPIYNTPPKYNNKNNTTTIGGTNTPRETMPERGSLVVDVDNVLFGDLKSLGVSQAEARKFIHAHSESKIREAIKYVQDRPQISNPGGYLANILSKGAIVARVEAKTSPVEEKRPSTPNDNLLRRKSWWKSLPREQRVKVIQIYKEKLTFTWDIVMTGIDKKDMLKDDFCDKSVFIGMLDSLFPGVRHNKSLHEI